MQPASYDGWQPIVEWDEWNNLKAWNVYGDGPDEILYRHDAARGDLRYHLDRMGNVAFLLDSDGDVIERYTYDAFGHPTVTDWNGDNPRTWSAYGNRFMFTGREYFPELGLYEFRNRFYYPALGRFLQSDPTGFDAGDANLFRYCGGDPINGSDPFGLGEQIVDYDGRVIVDTTAIEDTPNPFADERQVLWTDTTDTPPLFDYFNNISLLDDKPARLDDPGSMGSALPMLPSQDLPPLKRLFIPIFDPRTEGNIATLLPHVQHLAREHVYRVRQLGLDMRITDGSRTFAQQEDLFAQGRPGGRPGPIVTNAHGGESNHNFGTAYDVTFFNGLTPIWEGPEYDVAGRIGVEVGLEWGGNFIRRVDRPHFQYPGGQ